MEAVMRMLYWFFVANRELRQTVKLSIDLPIYVQPSPIVNNCG